MQISRLGTSAIAAGGCCSGRQPALRHVASSRWRCAAHIRQQRRTLRSRSTAVQAKAVWDEGGKPTGPVKSEREVERSLMVHQETIYFIFQLDLDTQLQRCLNYEAYEAAQQMRQDRQKVDEAIQELKQRKARNGSTESIQLSVTDFASEGLRLRTELQRAVEQERYNEAAKFRDLLKELETESRKAAALAAEWTSSAEPKFRLGQRVTHKTHGYRGMVVGWDSQCCESDDWMEAAGVQQLSAGMTQKFYHLLVDARDWEYDPRRPPVAYVAEELLTAPDVEPGGTSWVEVHGKESLQHPYSYILFLGKDAKGDYVPCRQLRDKYNVKRRDVYKPGEDGSEPMPEAPKA